jgi:ABC-2 type transport system permease protein
MTTLTLLKVERIKLFSTRSPWWCMGAAVFITVGFSALLAGTMQAKDLGDLTPATTQFSYNFGFLIMMVMAILAITTEYRFGTIRATFLAVPTRADALVAKAAVVALLAGLIGEAAGVGSWALSKAIRPDAPLSLDSAQDYRVVVGVGLVYMIATVVALSVGLLIRHSAGAITALLIWVMVAENLLPAIPRVGDAIQKWLPFTVGNNFLYAGQHVGDNNDATPAHMPLGAWGSLLYFALVAVVLLGVAVALAKRRDA